MHEFLNPVKNSKNYYDTQIGFHVLNDFDLIEKNCIVIVGCPELKGADLDDITDINSIRDSFYQLSYFNFEIPIIDIGDIKLSETLEDTYFKLKEISTFILEKQAFLIVIGGSKDLAFPIFQAFEHQNRPINFTEISAEIPIFKDKEGYLHKMILSEPNMLFHFAQIGYQIHSTDPMSIKFIESMDFEAYRLGHLTTNLIECEPVLRSSDFVIIDANSIESNNFFSKTKPQVNGFSNREICQISRYIGLSPQTQAFGLFNFISDKNYGNEQHLMGQIIWYLIDGLNNNKKINFTQDYIKYIVIQEDKEIIFYKDMHVERWWILVEWGDEEYNWLIPCTENDYLLANQGNLPERYWKTIKKFL